MANGSSPYLKLRFHSFDNCIRQRLQLHEFAFFVLAEHFGPRAGVQITLSLFGEVGVAEADEWDAEDGSEVSCDVGIRVWPVLFEEDTLPGVVCVEDGAFVVSVDERGLFFRDIPGAGFLVAEVVVCLFDGEPVRVAGFVSCFLDGLVEEGEVFPEDVDGFEGVVGEDVVRVVGVGSEVVCEFVECFDFVDEVADEHRAEGEDELVGVVRQDGMEPVACAVEGVVLAAVFDVDAFVFVVAPGEDVVVVCALALVFEECFLDERPMPFRIVVSLDEEYFVAICCEEVECVEEVVVCVDGAFEFPRAFLRVGAEAVFAFVCGSEEVFLVDGGYLEEVDDVAVEDEGRLRGCFVDVCEERDEFSVGRKVLVEALSAFAEVKVADDVEVAHRARKPLFVYKRFDAEPF